VQPRDQYGNNRTTLDSVDFQLSLEPITALPAFWVEKAGILDPTDMTVRPTEYKSRGYFEIDLMIYPQVRETPPSPCLFPRAFYSLIIRRVVWRVV
jgi:hypothetical protein